MKIFDHFKQTMIIQCLGPCVVAAVILGSAFIVELYLFLTDYR